MTLIETVYGAYVPVLSVLLSLINWISVGRHYITFSYSEREDSGEVSISLSSMFALWSLLHFFTLRIVEWAANDSRLRSFPPAPRTWNNTLPAPSSEIKGLDLLEEFDLGMERITAWKTEEIQ